MFFQKEISIVGNTAKKLKAGQFSENCFSKKAPGSKSILFKKIFLDFLKTVLVVDLEF